MFEQCLHKYTKMRNLRNFGFLTGVTEEQWCMVLANGGILSTTFALEKAIDTAC